MLYQNEKGKLKQIRQKPFALERELQTLVEQNLEELFHLQFLKTEFLKTPCVLFAPTAPKRSRRV